MPPGFLPNPLDIIRNLLTPDPNISEPIVYPDDGPDRQTPDPLSDNAYDSLFQDIRDNILDDYMNIRQHMVLSIVKFDPAVKWDFTSLKEQQTFGVMTNDMNGYTLATDRHYQITEMNMKNVLSVTEANQQISTALELKLNVVEPYGCSFNREMRRIAKEAGYGGLHPSKIVWRLDVWFSGYDSGGNYVEKISIADRFGQGATADVITHYISMLNFTCDIEAATSNYMFNFVPFFQTSLVSEISTMAYEQEIPLFDPEADNGSNRISFKGEVPIKFGIYASKFQELLNRYAAEITAKVQTKVNEPDERGYSPNITIPQIRNFQIIIPESLNDSLLEMHPDFYDEKFSNSLKITGKNIIEELQNKLAHLSIVRRNLTMYPKINYTIRPVMSYEQAEINSTIGDLTNVTVTFIIDEVVDFRVIPMTDDHMRQRNKEYFEQILQSGALRRIYQYSFSESNSEVVSFRLSLNNSWYNSIADNTYGIDYQNPISSDPQELELDERIRGTLTDTQMDQLRRTIGTSRDDEMNTIRPAYTGQQARARQRAIANVPEEKIKDYNDYLNALDQLAKLNFLTLDGFEVRGDPRWMFSAFSSASIPSDSSTLFRSDLIFVEITHPSQNEYMSVDFKSRPVPDADFSGFYQILSVEHTFRDNKYTQKFNGVRLLVNRPSESEAAQEAPASTSGPTAAAAPLRIEVVDREDL